MKKKNKPIIKHAVFVWDKKPKKNPVDATLRNVRAAKKREASLKERVKALEVLVRAQQRDISFLLSKVG